jgi:hypothetical protein
VLGIHGSTIRWECDDFAHDDKCTHYSGEGGTVGFDCGMGGGVLTAMGLPPKKKAHLILHLFHNS